MPSRLAAARPPRLVGRDAWWRSERGIRAALPAPQVGLPQHIAGTEDHWPSSSSGSHAGQVWAVEVAQVIAQTAVTTVISDETIVGRLRLGGEVG